MVSDGQLWVDTEILAEILSKVRNWFQNSTVFKGVRISKKPLLDLSLNFVAL